jgi:hypothetical protein
MYCLPEIPACYASIGLPALAEFQELLRLGELALFVGELETLLYCVIESWQHVRTAQTENQEHVDGPETYAADGGEARQDFVVGEFFDFFHAGDDAFDGFLSEIADCRDFLAGEACAAQLFVGGLLDLKRRGEISAADAVFYPLQDCGGGLAVQLLVDDGFDERVVGAGVRVHFHAEAADTTDQVFEVRVAGAEMADGFQVIERVFFGTGHFIVRTTLKKFFDGVKVARG